MKTYLVKLQYPTVVWSEVSIEVDANNKREAGRIALARSAANPQFWSDAYTFENEPGATRVCGAEVVES